MILTAIWLFYHCVFTTYIISFSHITAKRNEMMLRLAGNDGVRRLFLHQLQSLREYYGRRYEAFLDEIADEEYHDANSIINDDETEHQKKREKKNALLTDAATRATEGFRVAAQNAIPNICKEGALLQNAGGEYSYVSALEGLVRDIISSTQRLQDEWDKADMWEDNDGTEASSMENRNGRGPSKWYEKLAARALVLGVNYLQGWFALQGIRKAAQERDRNMPKFPLF